MIALLVSILLFWIIWRMLRLSERIEATAAADRAPHPLSVGDDTHRRSDARDHHRTGALVL
jgi:hypothetical protein